MAVSKHSISLEASVSDEVMRAAEADGVSFSTWLSDAARHRLRIRAGLRGVQEWERDEGTLTAEERAAGEALLDRLLDAREGVV